MAHLDATAELQVEEERRAAAARQRLLDASPFQGFKISNNLVLNSLDGRCPCPECGKSRKYFCYSCFVPLDRFQGLVPVIKLPIKIDIIKHKNEIDGKSTAAHAAVLAKDDVRVYTYPEIPDYSSERVVLIFPSQTAMTVTELVHCMEPYPYRTWHQPVPKGTHRGTLLNTVPEHLERLSVQDSEPYPITKAVFIDSTWNQSRGIYKDPRLKKLPCVVIQNRISQFWRHQTGSPRWYLSTVEAIHQFLVELHISRYGLSPMYEGINNCFSESNVNDFKELHRNNDSAYNGQYDDLLYFFEFMYHLIHSCYNHEDLHAYRRRLQ